MQREDIMYGYIYKIVNNVNRKVYIGQTVQSVNKRKMDHFKQLIENKHYNEHLQNSYNKYGDVFTFHVLNYAATNEELDELEIKYIAKYKATDENYGYNKIVGGSGVRHTPEMKEHKSKLLTANNPMKKPEIAKKCSDTLKERKIHKSKNNIRYRHDVFDNSYLTFLYWDLLLPTSFISNMFKISDGTVQNRLRDNGTCLKNKSLQNMVTIHLQSRFVKELQIPKSRHKYISYSTSMRKWRVIRTINRKTHYIGEYDTEKEARNALLNFNYKLETKPDDSYLTFLYWDLLLPSSFIGEIINRSASNVNRRLIKNNTCIKTESIRNSKPHLQSRYIKELQLPKSKYKNVYFNKNKMRWNARKIINGKLYTRYFYTQDEAYHAILKFNNK